MGKGDFLGEFEQMVLLAVLHQDRAGYGMSIRQEIEARTGRDPSIGSVYATLVEHGFGIPHTTVLGQDFELLDFV